MNDLTGKQVAWMTKDFGAVMGTVVEVTNYPDRPNRAVVNATSCERNCKRFIGQIGRWSVAVAILQIVG